jgi:hypothetical protein
MKNVLIIGATSAIAEATARIYAQRGDTLYLLARNEDRLSTLAADLRIRGAASVTTHSFDVNDFYSHPALIKSLFNTLRKLDVVLLAHGTLPDQKACEKDFQLALREINTNAIGTLSLLTVVANQLESQKSGSIAVITSVAGDRGRQSNYLYGSAKGMVSIFLQGLRNRLHKSNVHVLDIKPGFVDTPMTATFKKGLLWAKPETIANDIARGIDQKRDTIYTPFFWWLIMFIIRNIPERLFKRGNL